MLPLTRFGRVSAPWSQAQVPWSRRLALARYLGLPATVGFPQLSLFPTDRFHLAVPEPVTRPTTLLSLAGAGVVRPRAKVCTPPLSRYGRVRAPWFQAQAPGLFYISSRCAGFGAGDFPQFPLLSAVRFRPHGSEPVSRHTTLLSIAVRRCRPTACFGLHATPVS